MPNTYTQLLIHGVFAVRYRAAVLHPAWDERLRRYITGIVQNHKHKMIAINNVADHLHLLVGMSPDQSVSDMMKVVKEESSGFINDNKWTARTFRWQEGFGAFSHSKSQRGAVARYIENQQEHHRKKTFAEEYRKMLDDFEVAWDERYVFREME